MLVTDMLMDLQNTLKRTDIEIESVVVAHILSYDKLRSKKKEN